jgi:hypothetical protein
MMPAVKKELQGLLWFAGGFALAAILSVSYEAVHFVPMAVAFGLLCFGCGVLLFTYLSLRRREDAFIKTSVESYDRWTKEFEELRKDKAELEKEKEAFAAEQEPE